MGTSPLVFWSPFFCVRFRKVSSLDLPYHEEFCRQRTDSVFIFYRELRVFSLLSTFSPNSSLAAPSICTAALFPGLFFVLDSAKALSVSFRIRTVDTVTRSGIRAFFFTGSKRFLGQLCSQLSGQLACYEDTVADLSVLLN